MAYTYLIGWTKYNKWYYGARFAKNCDPTDLWKTYFTSSKYVKKFFNEYGNPDVIEIRKNFLDKSKCIEWENKVLLRMNVIRDDKWLNKTNNKAIVISDIDAWKNSIKQSTKGVKKTITEKAKLAYKQGGETRRGKPNPKPENFSNTLSNIKTGGKWYHNPKLNKETFIIKNKQVPDGYVKGRINPSKHGGRKGEYTKERYDKIAYKQSKEYKITYPTGDVVYIKNLSKYCRENNLCKSNMAKGKYKGIICEKI